MTEPRTTPGPGRALPVALLVSGVMHAGLFVWLVLTGTGLEVGFELHLPSDVELGMTEAVAVAPATSRAVAPVPPSAPASSGSGSARLDAGVPPDAASAEDAGRRRRRDAASASDGSDESASALAAGDAGTEPDAALVAAIVDGGDDGAVATPTARTGTYRIPPGAQLAFRMDMTRVRASPLADDVRRLLAAIADWRALLDGSDISPVDDLERILIASPNLERARMVFAGRHEGDEQRVREVVARMAAARGVEAHWTERAGVPVAPWPDADETERLVAIVGPRHFVIARPEDLPRVLAIAHARAERRRDAGSGPARDADEDVSPADALLAMEPGEVVTFEVEGAHAFVRGERRHVPLRGRLAVADLVEGRSRVTVEAVFATPEEAAQARDYWNAVRESQMRGFWVQAFGLASALERTTLEARDSSLLIETRLDVGQLRFALAYAEGLLGRPRPRPTPTSSLPSSPRGTAAPSSMEDRGAGAEPGTEQQPRPPTR
ncbi:MAG: hypothetical protein NZ898_14175 [Myxococcota bacterium]|nr:hypothetical protein [Myxococcota bacterium]MDW8362204.1 hypothetical protein [Myxococcales bacterium]